MKANLWVIETAKKTYVSMEQVDNRDIEVHENKEPYFANLYEHKEEAEDHVKNMTEGHEYWRYDGIEELVPFKIIPVRFELIEEEK